MKTGCIIFIHGPDKSGKGTQSLLLSSYLAKKGYDVEWYTFPDYSTIGGILVDSYLRKENHTIPREVSSMFYALDRAYQSKAIKQARDGGKVVVCKRSSWSNICYQTGLMNIPADHLKSLDVYFPNPNLSIMIDVSDEVANGRYTTKPDLHESMSQQPVRDIMRFLHSYEILPSDSRTIIKGSESIGHVFKDLVNHVASKLNNYNLKFEEDNGSLVLSGRLEPLPLDEVMNMNFGDLFKTAIDWTPQKRKIKNLDDLFNYSELQISKKELFEKLINHSFEE